jgi:hypothetical protein
MYDVLLADWPKLEGVHKLFLTFSPAKPRNISISEQK